MFTFFTILVVISVFLCFLLTIFFLVTPRGSASGNRTLAALLMVFGLQILYAFMTSNYAFRYFLEWHKPIYLIRQASFLTGPLVYFYVVAFIKRKENFGRQNRAHFIPFAASVIFLMIWYTSHEQFIIWESELGMMNTILILLSNFTYILLSVSCLHKAGITFRSLFKSISASPHITWLQILLLGYMVIWIVNLNSFTIYMIARGPGWCAYTAGIFALVLFLFVNLLMFLLLIKPDIYYILTKYKNSKLEDHEKKDCLLKLNTYMNEHKPYLNPDVTLEQLAGETGMNPRVLSQIINESCGKSFKNYILDFRIKESMKVLADHKAHNLTILEVLYQVGFNSKSAFNYQFKLYTNLTPQQYRARKKESVIT